MNNDLENDLMVVQSLFQDLYPNGFKNARASVSNDNIFSVLEVVRKEVPYCRVLLYLIKNNWNSFKEKVLDGCCGNEELTWFELEHRCDSPCEYYNKEGRIDILLKTENHIVVIEVKINADDQEHQLLRYKKEIENEYKEAKKTPNIHIIYLTVDGRDAFENSLQCKKCKMHCSIDAKDYKRISFNQTIYNWLADLISDYDENSIAKQFLEVLELEKVNNEKYLEILRKSADYPMMVYNLKEMLPFLFTEIREEFFEKLKSELIKEHNYVENLGERDTYKRETWAVNLMREDKKLSFCYETNFFLRTGLEDKNWIYINRNSLDGSTEELGTRKSALAFNIKSLDASSEKLLRWSHKNEEEKMKIIKKIAIFADNFAQK